MSASLGLIFLFVVASTYRQEKSDNIVSLHIPVA